MVTVTTIKSNINDFRSLANGSWNNRIWIDDYESNDTFLFAEIDGCETLISKTTDGLALTITQNEQTALVTNAWEIINQLKTSLEN